jgi:hypothetical protein
VSAGSMVPGMRSESVYSLRQERLLPILTTARGPELCADVMSDLRFWSVQRHSSLLPDMSVKTGDLVLRPAQE